MMSKTTNGTFPVVSASKPGRVVYLAFPNTTLSTVAAPADVFLSPGVLANRIRHVPIEPIFRIRIVSLDGDPITFLGGLRMQVDGAYADVEPEDADLIMIAPVVDFPGIERALPKASAWLTRMYAGGVPLASVCTGAFLLAATGLLDGKTATTHWGAVPAFRTRYPQVRLKPQRLVTDEGDLFCSGGSHAGVDLALYLVRRICGPEVAIECSRLLLHDPARQIQSPYALLDFQKEHGDDAVLTTQEHLERDYDQVITVADLARRVGQSQRTFERRFRAATGDTPVRYLQRVRVEAAKRLLEQTGETFEQITFRVGYGDPASFRRIFFRQTGLSPGVYRQRFSSRLWISA